MKNMIITGFVLIIAIIVSMGCVNIFNSDIKPNAEEYSIISETNRVRTNPKGYALELHSELDANRSAWDQSRIGRYEAAIATLNSAAVQSPLSYDYGLFLAARDHAEDMIENNLFSHVGSDGSSPNDRMDRYGTYSGARGENVAAGTNNDTGASMVLAWVLSPGHLSNMLRENYTLIGTAHLSGHPGYNWISVQKFAGGKN